MPRGVGIQTIFGLADGGFSDEALSNSFAITAKGQEALKAGVLEWTNGTSSPPPSPGADNASISRRAPPPEMKKKEPTTPFVSQSQIEAVLKAAKSEGASVEIRFEKDSVRLILLPSAHSSKVGV